MFSSSVLHPYADRNLNYQKRMQDGRNETDYLLNLEVRANQRQTQGLTSPELIKFITRTVLFTRRLGPLAQNPLRSR